ncbi:alpha/beta hydrolase [Niastella vici]|uniref:Alpha/beta hydrolase n=1 Tax=Niastella vici TaxID=1703345 RepID=A0A1V9FS21_9BACT|nr:alpha/beta hydrolase [Niastella vici]OQP61189.1 alpha/beta hydrolase [Niastella vici]
MKQSMVLLHGLFGGLSNWHSVVGHFQSNYNIHIPVLPMFDRHNNNELDYLTGFLESYIHSHSLLDVILVGNSLGGHVAILYTHRHPEKVSRLVLTGSSGLYENTSMGSYPKRGNYAYIRERVAYTFYDPAVATDPLVDEVFGITTDPHKCLSIVRMAKSAQRHYVAGLLPHIHVPALLIWGEEDRITPPAVAREFETLLPRARLVMFPQCGHAPMMEKPAEFNRVLEKFLDGSGV